MDGYKQVLKSAISYSKQNRSLPQPPFRSKATYSLLPSCLAGRKLLRKWSIKRFIIISYFGLFPCISYVSGKSFIVTVACGGGQSVPVKKIFLQIHTCFWPIRIHHYNHHSALQHWFCISDNNSNP